MRLKSFSKINLTLRVLKKLKSGLHNIETNSTLIDLYDEINIKKNKKDMVIFRFFKPISYKLFFNFFLKNSLSNLESLNLLPNKYKFS